MSLPAPVVSAGVGPVVDRRVRIMASLVTADWLPGEWDPDRLLLIPSDDGLLARRLRPCVVPACSGTAAGSLCRGHAGEFDQSGLSSAEEWIASGGPGPRRRRLPADSCVVSNDEGTRCPRPARGSWDLCLAHKVLWSARRSEGATLAEFLAGAKPLRSFGDCTAASCYRSAEFGEVGLCRAHYGMWMAAGSPRGGAIGQWRRRVRQPLDGRVLSLRGLSELVALEVLYAMQCRLAEQIRTTPGNMRAFVDHLRATDADSVLDCDLALIDADDNRDHGRFARYTLDRVALAYRDPEAELAEDRWDLRVVGRRGTLDFSPIRQDWLREGTKRWAATTIGRVKDTPTMQVRVRAVAILSNVLATGPGGGHDPTVLGRRDLDRFLLRLRSLRSPASGEPLSATSAFSVAKGCGLVVREATEMGFLPGLNPTFSFRRGDAHWPVVEEEGRALPAYVVTHLDAHLDLLADIPGYSTGSRQGAFGVLGDHAGAMAVLAYWLLKATGRRLGEVASLHLNCLELDETAKAVLVYDNHKAGRMRRRLPLADSALVDAISHQQRWVTERFADTPRDGLWLLPRPNKNTAGDAHIGAGLINQWIKAWVTAMPAIDTGPPAGTGEPILFDRRLITPHAFRHTYAQTLADQGVAAPVLRDLMDHRNMNTTLGYYRVNEKKKRQAMEMLARHTVDNRGSVRPAGAQASRTAGLREQLSWVAVPMGKCSEPTNVRAGGQSCPIRYQCAGCPHFETDPSYLPELRSYADDLRREREIGLAVGAAGWVIDNVASQLGVIDDHIARHEQLLDSLAADQRDAIDEASRTVRKVRQSVPVAFGRRHPEPGDD